jgi:hypothetical protein
VATASFNLPSASWVNITLNDLQGRLQRTLLDENLSAGNHSIQIPKKNLSAGVYLLQMKQGTESVIKRLIIE